MMYRNPRELYPARIADPRDILADTAFGVSCREQIGDHRHGGRARPKDLEDAITGDATYRHDLQARGLRQGRRQPHGVHTDRWVTGRFRRRSINRSDGDVRYGLDDRSM